MSDNLRGAVAELVMHFLSDRELAWLTQDQALALADAVIRELCLHREEMSEWAVLAEGHRYVIYRYVTDWIDPQTKQKVDLP